MSLLNDSHKELREAVKNDNLVIFAGAGISKSVGLPLWGELVSKIIEHINTNNSDYGSALKALYDNQSAKNNIFDVLSYIERYKLNAYVNHILKDEIYEKGNALISKNPILPLHSKLWQVSKKIITPNYDQLFESCTEYKKWGYKLISNKSILDLAKISEIPEYLLKIHGNISEIGDIIFYESQYEQQYERDSAVVSKLKELVANHPILFVGTSMTDPYVNKIIQEVNSIFHYTSAQNFILSTDELNTSDIIKINGDPITDLPVLLDELLSIKNTDSYPISLLTDTSVLNKLETTISINKLNLYPKPKQYFTGRDKEIEIFKKAIDDGNNFIAIDGAGGIGKTQFVAKCIEKYIPDEKVMWFDCKPESHFDTLIISAGYPELLEGSSKTERDKFSAFKDKIEENDYFLFLDNFQETNSKPIFKEFLLFIQDYLKRGCVIVIDRDDITTLHLRPKRIRIEKLAEKRLEYAKALIQHSYADLIAIEDAELVQLCDELQGYPLAIDFAILLLSEGEKHSDIISRIVHAEEGEDISERLLNAIFSRPDATKEERDFMLQFSVFTGSIPSQVVKAIIAEEVMTVAPKKLRKKNLISYSNDNYETHPLVRAFSYKKLKDKEGMHKKVAEYYIQTRTEELNPILEERIFYHLSLSKQWVRIEQEIVAHGRKFILLGQFDLIKELIEKLKEQKLIKPIFNIFSGDIAEIQGHWNEAQKHYELAKNHEENKKVKAEGMVKYAEILHRKGNVKGALPFYEEAYEFTKNDDSLKKENARAINDIGLVFHFFGDTGNALLKFNEALKVRIEIEDKEDVATSFSNIGGIYDIKGELIRALEYYQKGLKIEEEIGNKQGIANSFGNLGNIYDTKGELDKALEYHQKSLKIEEEIGNKEGIASSFGSLGSIYRTQGDLGKSLEYHQESLKIEEEIGNKRGIASSFGNIGNIYHIQGDLDMALEYHLKSLKIKEALGNKQGIASSFGNIGGIYHSQGNLDMALEYHQKSLTIQKEIGYKKGIAASFGNIGGTYDAQGALDKALEYHQKSLKIKEEIGYKQGIASSLGNIGNIYQTQGALDKALEYHQKSLKIEEALSNKQGIATSLGDMGNIYYNQGELDTALEYHQNGLNIVEEIGNKQGIASLFINIGIIYSDERKKQNNLAIIYLLKSLSISNSIGAKRISRVAKNWIVSLRAKLGLKTFKKLARQEYEKLSKEMQKHIPMHELLNEPIRKERKIGRNDPCHCGSGKKYKHCHGK